eukprot:GEMP01037487.1.p1 GENE.GEMP01037487.1~~GEMP01037487.1.p1  ORF type:complete len:386 (+),score=47.87 GEMP01037487.1:305-1462(+)
MICQMTPWRKRHQNHDDTVCLHRRDAGCRPPSPPKMINPFHPEMGAWKTLQRLARLALHLQWWVGFPGKWLWQMCRLILFIFVALPAFLPPFFRYLRNRRIHKHIAYGRRFRQQLDAYLPLKAHRFAESKGRGEVIESPALPVIFFCPGGAWIIGYKFWAFLIYRNFPEVSCSNMLADIDAALDWVLANIEDLGGDVDNITLMGQSAGAHLTASLMLHSVKGERGTQSVFRRYIGVSGPYDLSVIIPCMHERGLHHKLVTYGLFEGDVDRFDPIKLAEVLSIEEMRRLPQEILLWHGKKDVTCPWQVTLSFAKTLNDRGYFNIKCKIFDHDTHTSPIIENPLQGKDDLTDYILEMLHPAVPASERVYLKVYFPFLAKIAAYINPF